MGEVTTRWTSYRGHRFAYRYHAWDGSNMSSGAPSASAPIVFLNGAFQSMDSWKRFVDAFQPHADVLLVDLPGTGQADALPADAPLGLLADALAYLLDELDIERVYLVAASYGTPAGYIFGQRYPDRLTRLALCGIMKEVPAHERITIRRSVHMARSGDVEGLAFETVRGLLADEPGRVRRAKLARRVLASGVRSLTSHDLERYALNTERLLASPPLDLDQPPRAPSLLFTGEHDVFTTPERVAEVARGIPGAAFTVIREADHLCHVERFEVAIDLLDRFRRGTLSEAKPVEWTAVRWTPVVTARPATRPSLVPRRRFAPDPRPQPHRGVRPSPQTA